MLTKKYHLRFEPLLYAHCIMLHYRAKPPFILMIYALLFLTQQTISTMHEKNTWKSCFSNGVASVLNAIASSSTKQ